MPLLLLVLALGSAYGAKKYYDTKNPKFFYWLDSDISESDKQSYTEGLFDSDDIEHLKTLMTSAYTKKHFQAAEILGEKIMAMEAYHGDKSIAIWMSKADSALEIYESFNKGN